MAKITKVEQKMPTIKAKKRVAAYARISMESERMHHSLSAQISYYNALIQKKPEWEFAGVYADDGISGTGIAKRTEFQRMLADCEAGKINIILTKSIQRFARNTVDLLETVRHLKDIGVEVRFEKENINSMSGDGELMLSILASFAQEESRSISENVKWGTKKRFEQGIPNGHFQIYGYRWEGDHLVVEPEEAKIVKLIFDNFMNGLSAESTEKQLEEMGVKSYKGVHFSNSSIRQILSNVTYTGNLLFQKEYVSDPNTGWKIHTKPSFRWKSSRQYRKNVNGAENSECLRTGASIHLVLQAKSSAPSVARIIAGVVNAREKILTKFTTFGFAE